MGGPCFLRLNDNTRTRAPPCTDNFQVKPFDYNNKTWQSAEQAYQASKFTEEGIQEKIRSIKKAPNESDYDHGMTVWSVGQEKGKVHPDWDKIKVDTMFDVNWAKYKSNPDLVAELLGTGKVPIDGAPSTGWRHPKLGYQDWSMWNGLIQMRVRELLRPEPEQDKEMLRQIEATFAMYRAGYP